MCFKKPFFSLCSLRLYNFYFDNLCNIIKSTAYLIDLLIILEKKMKNFNFFCNTFVVQNKEKLSSDLNSDQILIHL